MTATELTKYEMFLQNPSLYVGKCSNGFGEIWTIDKNKLVLKTVSWNSILLKMFDELLMNALDNFKCKVPMTFINCQFSPDSEKIVISNNGKAISLSKTKTVDGTTIFNPELIFSRLFTSTHYSKKEENIAGMNGIGAKIATVFSTNLHIRIINNGTLYEQDFQPKEKEIYTSVPKISKLQSENLTEITFEPDFEKLGCTPELFSDTLQVFIKRLIDVKLSEPVLRIILNGEEILKEFTIDDFWKLFKKEKFIRFQYGRIALSSSFKQFSVINGISVSRGGDHIQKIVNEITGYVEQRMRKTGLKSIVKSSLFILFIGTCAKPSFTSQDKVELDKGFPQTILKEKDLKAIWNELGIGQLILGREREKSTASNSTTAKRLQIKDLTDATYAGTSKSKDCVLFLAEGLSALSFAKIGMKTVLNANYFGCYPVGGKILNVRKSKIEKANANEVLKNIEKILGLRAGARNDNLRYGRVVMLKDADTDGAEILGLLINFFHHHYPEVLSRSFIYEFVTPMIKLFVPESQSFQFPHSENVIKKGNTFIVPFYNEQEFNSFKESHPEIQNMKTEYIKGLAGNEDFEVSHYFTHRDVNEIELIADEHLNETIEIVYGKDSSKRKEWMFDTTERFLERCRKINISDFLNNDVLMFSFENCQRSIPSVIDGLKPSQRKVLWTLFNSSRKNEFQKVFMLTGQIASFAYYNHGDGAMNETIIKMAQTYPGSNNLNLLEPSGFFGSREYLGDDHGAPRYIKCRLNKEILNIFPEIDTKLLPKNFEDNVQIEPKFFVPIIPMVLCNGCRGIGTGYSTFVPMFSVSDLKSLIIDWLETGEFKEIIPKVNGFNGQIRKIENGYQIDGVWKLTKRTSNFDEYEVTEIPYNISIADFEEKLKELFNSKRILNFEYGSKNDGINSVNYLIRTPSGTDLSNLLQLQTRISSKNFTLFSPNGSIHKYESIEDILIEWSLKRYEAYEIRKDFQLKELTKELNIQESKLKFILEIVPILRESDDETILSKLESDKYFKIEGKFDYLLQMPLRQLTPKNVERLKKEIEEIKNKLSKLSNQSVKEMWLIDLNKLKD